MVASLAVFKFCSGLSHMVRSQTAQSLCTCSTHMHALAAGMPPPRSANRCAHKCMHAVLHRIKTTLSNRRTEEVPGV